MVDPGEEARRSAKFRRAPDVSTVTDRQYSPTRRKNRVHTGHARIRARSGGPGLQWAAGGRGTLPQCAVVRRGRHAAQLRAAFQPRMHEEPGDTATAGVAAAVQRLHGVQQRAAGRHALVSRGDTSRRPLRQGHAEQRGGARRVLRGAPEPVATAGRRDCAGAPTQAIASLRRGERAAAPASAAHRGARGVATLRNEQDMPRLWQTMYPSQHAQDTHAHPHGRAAFSVQLARVLQAVQRQEQYEPTCELPQAPADEGKQEEIQFSRSRYAMSPGHCTTLRCQYRPVQHIKTRAIERISQPLPQMATCIIESVLRPPPSELRLPGLPLVYLQFGVSQSIFSSPRNLFQV